MRTPVPPELAQAYLDAIRAYEAVATQESAPAWHDPVFWATTATALATAGLVWVAFRQVGALIKDADNRDRTVRDEARRQNTLTFLLQSESDREILEGYKAYGELFIERVNTLTPRMIVDPGASTLMPHQLEAARSAYRRVLRVLNVMELGAVGIKNNILDERVLFDWWADFYVASFCRMLPAVAAIRVINSGYEKLGQGSPAPMNADALFSGAQERARHWRDALEAAHPENRVYDRYRAYFHQDIQWWMSRMDTPLNDIYDALER